MTMPNHYPETPGADDSAQATRATEDLRREIERRKADRNLLKENGIEVP